MRRSALLVALCVLACLIGCGRPPKPRIDTVYRGLTEKLPRIDPEILSGRRIVIDPGHGGHFPGTLGQEGLAESSVNLGVSLYLWGLLREAGARVELTRSSERDFLSASDSSLAADLQARIAVLDSLEPEIFVSIHHNAQPQRDPAANAIETYYKLGDPASMDLAFTVHRHLMRNLGIEQGEVRPGNYYVLRSVDVPAILGEGSYLTHPVVEEKLKLSEKQRLEAEAYFLGILEYFSRGTPRLRLLSPVDSMLTIVPVIQYSVEDVGGLGIDPGSQDMTVNGQRVSPVLDTRSGAIRYRMPWDAPNGLYEVSLGVRNLMGNASPIHLFRFEISFPPETAILDYAPSTLPRGGGTVRIRARLLDRRGLDVTDGTPVGITVSSGTAPGIAHVERGFAEFPVRVPPGLNGLDVTLSVRGREFTLAVPGSPAAVPTLRQVVIADAASRRPVVRPLIIYGDSILDAGSAGGVSFIPASLTPERPVCVKVPGYRPVTFDDAEADTILLDPWFHGRLLGSRFVLDPEGGRRGEAGLGRLGLSGAHVNLQVARYLAGYLREAGADVLITRDSEATRTPQDIVEITNGFRAHRYIEIRHRNIPADSGRIARSYYFPGSATGEDMAGKVQRALARTLEIPTSLPHEQVTFPLQQTACPAIVVEAPSLGILEEELRLGEPWYVRLQAYGIFVGLLEHFGLEDSTRLEVGVSADAIPDNWLVTVDDSWNLLTSPGGRATFYHLPPGPHVVEARRRSELIVHEFVMPQGGDFVIRLDAAQ